MSTLKTVYALIWCGADEWDIEGDCFYSTREAAEAALAEYKTPPVQIGSIHIVDYPVLDRAEPGKTKTSTPKLVDKRGIEK